MNTVNLFTEMKLASLFAFLFTVLPINVIYANGGVNGGGGKGVLCGTQLTVLDLYEAKQNNLILPAPVGNTDAEIDRFGPRILNHFITTEKAAPENILLQNMKDVLNQKKPDIETDFIFKWERNLSFTNDATLPKIEPECRFVQIGVNRIIHINNHKVIEVILDPYYWEKLDSLNKVALFFHEVTYSRERSGYDLSDIERNKLTSDETRKVIGLLLAGVDTPNIIGQDISKKPQAWCGFGGGTTNGGNEEHFEIYVYEEIKNSQKGLGLYFFGFKERLVASQTFGFLPGFSLDQLVRKFTPEGREVVLEEIKPVFPTQTITVHNKLMNKMWELQLGTNKYGLTIQAFEPGTPLESRPNLSSGFCSFE